MMYRRFIFISALFLSAPLFAVDFIDDFSTDFTSPPYSVNISNVADDAAVFSETDRGLSIALTNSAPDVDDRTSISFDTFGTLASFGYTFEFTSADFGGLNQGNARVLMLFPLYNTREDGSVNPSFSLEPGDVEATLDIRYSPDEIPNTVELCIQEFMGDDTFEPAIDGLPGCFDLETIPEFGTTYDVNVSFDDERNLIEVGVNDDVTTYPAPVDTFLPRSMSNTVAFQIRDGSVQGDVVLEEIRTNRFSDSDFTPALIESPYRTDDLSNDPSRTRDVSDGVLTLTAINSDVDSDNTTSLQYQDPSNFVGADITYSSNSDVALNEEGFNSVRLAGIMYRDTMPPDDDSLIGAVFGIAQLIVNSDGLLVGEYCLIRSSNEDFSETTDLADGMDDGRCPQFDLPIVADQSYAVSMQLDPDNNMVIYKIDDEVKEVIVNSDIFPTGFDTKRAESRISEGATGTVVGVFDNLRNFPPSDDETIGDAAEGDGTTGGNNSEGDAVADNDVTDTDELLDVATSSSSGGCSVSGSNTGHGFMLMLLVSLALLIRRRRNL